MDEACGPAEEMVLRNWTAFYAIISNSKEEREEQNTNPVFRGLKSEGGLGPALREDVPIATFANKFGIHSMLVNRWKKETVVSMEVGLTGKLEAQQAEIKELHANIGQLPVERAFLLERALPLEGQEYKFSKDIIRNILCWPKVDEDI
jgi:transposase